jgi:hypothetical protein
MPEQQPTGRRFVQHIASREIFAIEMDAEGRVVRAAGPLLRSTVETDRLYRPADYPWRANEAWWFNNCPEDFRQLFFIEIEAIRADALRRQDQSHRRLTASAQGQAQSA